MNDTLGAICADLGSSADELREFANRVHSAVATLRSVEAVVLPDPVVRWPYTLAAAPAAFITHGSAEVKVEVGRPGAVIVDYDTGTVVGIRSLMACLNTALMLKHQEEAGS